MSSKQWATFKERVYDRWRKRRHVSHFSAGKNPSPERRFLQFQKSIIWRTKFQYICRAEEGDVIVNVYDLVVNRQFVVQILDLE